MKEFQSVCGNNPNILSIQGSIYTKFMIVYLEISWTFQVPVTCLRAKDKMIRILDQILVYDMELVVGKSRSGAKGVTTSQELAKYFRRRIP
jgi:hypothetical protein